MGRGPVEGTRIRGRSRTGRRNESVPAAKSTRSAAGQKERGRSADRFGRDEVEGVQARAEATDIRPRRTGQEGTHHERAGGAGDGRDVVRARS